MHSRFAFTVAGLFGDVVLRHLYAHGIGILCVLAKIYRAFSNSHAQQPNSMRNPAKILACFSGGIREKREKLFSHVIYV